MDDLSSFILLPNHPLSLFSSKTKTKIQNPPYKSHLYSNAIFHVREEYTYLRELKMKFMCVFCFFSPVVYPSHFPLYVIHFFSVWALYILWLYLHIIIFYMYHLCVLPPPLSLYLIPAITTVSWLILWLFFCMWDCGIDLEIHMLMTLLYIFVGVKFGTIKQTKKWVTYFL